MVSKSPAGAPVTLDGKELQRTLNTSLSLFPSPCPPALQAKRKGESKQAMRDNVQSDKLLKQVPSRESTMKHEGQSI